MRSSWLVRRSPSGRLFCRRLCHGRFNDLRLAREKQFGRSSIEVAKVLSSVGLVYEMLGEMDSAFEAHNECLVMSECVLGADHADIGRCPTRGVLFL